MASLEGLGRSGGTTSQSLDRPARVGLEGCAWTTVRPVRGRTVAQGLRSFGELRGHVAGAERFGLERGGLTRCGALEAVDLGDAQPELLVDDDDLAAGDRAAGDQQVDGLVGEPVQRDDRALAQAHRLAERHVGAADLHGELHGDVREAREVVAQRAGEVAGLGQGREFDVGHGWSSLVLGVGYWIARSVNMTSSASTSVSLSTRLRTAFWMLARDFSLCRRAAGMSVSASVMIARTAASWGSVP